jgi:hypothetical protein
MKKVTCVLGAATLGTVLRLDLVRYRNTRPTWKLAQQLRASINAISDRRQRGFMSHEWAITELEQERDKLHGLLRRMWWIDRLRMRLWLWLVDDMIHLLKQGSARTVYYRQVG